MEEIKHYFQIYLVQLKKEIEAYPDEASIWRVERGISNSAGNLCIHLIGNLNHFIGHGLGHTDYVRDREAEFNMRSVPRADLVRMLQETTTMVEEVLGTVENPHNSYPEELFGYSGSIQFFLFKLLTHLSYHIGQINYHRRFLAKNRS